MLYLAASDCCVFCLTSSCLTTFFIHGLLVSIGQTQCVLPSCLPDEVCQTQCVQYWFSMPYQDCIQYNNSCLLPHTTHPLTSNQCIHFPTLIYRNVVTKTKPYQLRSYIVDYHCVCILILDSFYANLSHLVCSNPQPSLQFYPSHGVGHKYQLLIGEVDGSSVLLP